MVKELVQDVTAGMGQIPMLLLQAHLPPLVSGLCLPHDNSLLLLLNLGWICLTNIPPPHYLDSEKP